MAQPKPVSTDDLLSQVITGLRTAAVRPNVLGYVPHEKQKTFHDRSTKGRLYIGGNRSGKTTAGVVEGIWRLTGKHPSARPPFIATTERPIRGRVVGVDYPNGIEKILLPEYARWTPLSELRGGSWESSYQARLKTLFLENGSTVEFMSYDQDIDKFAGTSRDFIHFDEEPPEEVFNENIARLIDTGGPWWITMTPVEGMTWIYDKIYIPGTEGTAKHISVVEARMEENPHLNKSEIDLYLSGLDADERRARGQGKFVQMGGLVFKSFDPKVHVSYQDDPGFLEIAELKSSKWRWYCSLDHGYNNPTAVLWHAVNSDNLVVTFGEHYASEMTLEEHSKIIHEKNAIYNRKPDIYVCDPALGQRSGITGTSIHAEYNSLQIPFVLGNNDVSYGIVKMNQYLRLSEDGKPHWIIQGQCLNLIREIARLRWKTYTSKKIGSKNNKQELIHKKDDHAPDSARYFFTMMPDLAPEEFKKKKDDSWKSQFESARDGRFYSAPVYDPNFANPDGSPKQQKSFPKTQWTAVDEFVGEF